MKIRNAWRLGAMVLSVAALSACDEGGATEADLPVDAGGLVDAARDASPNIDARGPTNNVGPDCGLVACLSGVNFERWPLAGTLDDIKAGSVEICRNGTECVSTELSALDGEPSVGSGIGYSVNLDADAGAAGQLRISLWAAGAGYALDASVDLWSSEGLQDGDVWRIRQLASDGSAVQSLERTAGYTLLQPNRPCGPICERLTVKLGQ